MKQFQIFIKPLSILSVLLFLNSCALLNQFLGKENQPSFSIKSVDITKITLENISLKLQTSVENHYPISLPKSILDMTVYIEGTAFAKFSKIDLGKIESNATKDVPVDVLIKYSDLLEIYKKLPGKELLTVKLDGVVTVPIPETYQVAGKKSFEFPFTKEKQIPAVLPTIDIRNFKIIKPEPAQIASTAKEAVTTAAMSYLDGLLSGKKTTVGSAASAGLSNVDINVDTEFEIVLANKAAAALKFSDLKYDLTLNGEKFLSGVPVDIINKGKESIVKVKTSFPLKSVSSGIASAIQKKSSDYKLKGLSGLNVPGLPDGTMNFDYDKKGNFKW